MRKSIRFLMAGLIILAISAIGRSMVVKYNAYLVNEAGLAYNKLYPLPLNSYQIDNIAFTSIVSSVTFANETFTDGQQSTGTITVTSITGISTAAASGYLTVVATLPATMNIILTVNGMQINQLSDPFEDTTTTATAINIKNSINFLNAGVLASTGANSTVYSTATSAGSYGNNITYTTNISTAYISFSSYISSGTTGAVSKLSGGRDGVEVTINGKGYVAGTDYAVGATAATTATNLATAITASSGTYFVRAGSGGSIVFATSTIVGSNTNYIITSSSDALLTVGGSIKTVTGLNGASIGQMWGGSDSAYTLVNTSATVIHIANNLFTLGLPVLYVTTSGQAITGLTTQTTYYVIPVTPNSVSLSNTSTGAVAGIALILKSSQIKTTADIFTLSALPITGNPSCKWEISNDGAVWYPYLVDGIGVAIPSLTFSSFVSTGTYTNWDFRNVNYSWLRLNVVSPTTGAIKFQVIGNGKNTSN